MWADTRVWGEHNQLVDGGRSTLSKKSARELAVMCLDQMGEVGYDVSALPDDVYPAVSWDAEVAPDALDAICTEFGCIVVLHVANNRVKIWRNNSGARPAVDARATDATPSAEPKIVPPALIFEGGHTLWQRDLLLEPIGVETLENKEVVKPIDQLSYTPAGGWESQDPRSFRGVEKEHRALAKRCVYRMFRVKPPFVLQPPPMQLATSGKSTSGTDAAVASFFTVARDELWRILPLGRTQVSSVAGDDARRTRGALLMGAFVEKNTSRKNNVDKDEYPFTSPDSQLPADTEADVDKLIFQGSWSLDVNEGIVTTQTPMYYLENGKPKAPYLRLRTSFGLRHPETKQRVSQQYRYITGASNSAGSPQLVKQSDVVFEIQEGRGAVIHNEYLAPVGLESVTNADQFIQIAEAYLGERLASLFPDEAITIPYKGFVFDWEVDGSVRAVTWSASPQGGRTVIDYAIERPEMRLTHTQLRNQANQALAIRQQAEASKRVARLLDSRA